MNSSEVERTQSLDLADPIDGPKLGGDELSAAVERAARVDGLAHRRLARNVALVHQKHVGRLDAPQQQLDDGTVDRQRGPRLKHLREQFGPIGNGVERGEVLREGIGVNERHDACHGEALCPKAGHYVLGVGNATQFHNDMVEAAVAQAADCR